MFNLRSNTRLLALAIGATLWAYLGIAAALAQRNGVHDGQEPGVALRVGMPRGAVLLPGRIVEVTEGPASLRIVMAVRDLEQAVSRGPDGQPVRNLPPGVSVEYVSADSLQAAADGEPLRPRISMLQGQDRPLRLRDGKEVLVGKDFYLGLKREGVALIPHGGDGLRLMEGPLRRRGWGEGERQQDGGPRWPRERLRERWEERRERGEGGGQRPPNNEQHPPKDDQRPPDEGEGRPPHNDGGKPPPRDAEKPPPHDGERRPPRDGDKRPPPEGQKPPPRDGGHAPPKQDQPPPREQRPPDGGGRPPAPPRGPGGPR